MSTNRYGIYAVQRGATLVGGIMSESIDLGSQIVADSSSGEVYPRWVSLVGQRPNAKFTSKHIGTCIGVSGTMGNYLTTGNVMNLYLQRWAEGITRASGNAHRKVTVNKGLLLPTRLSGRSGSDATMSCDVAALYDGTNSPLTILDNQALPAPSTADERYVFHKATIAGQTFDSDMGCDIDFGITPVIETVRSEVWPRWGSVAGQTATITITAEDIEALADARIPMGGVATTHVNTILYFRRRLNGSTFAADSSGTHMTITAAGMASITNAFDGSNQSPGGMAVQVTCVFDGTNAPLLVSTSANIA